MPKRNKSLSPVYSYRWAQGVVQEYTEKMYRATRILAELSGLSLRQTEYLMIYHLRCGDQAKWQRIKWMLKIINNDIEAYSKAARTPMRQGYLDYIRVSADDLWLDELEENP